MIVEGFLDLKKKGRNDDMTTVNWWYQNEKLKFMTKRRRVNFF